MNRMRKIRLITQIALFVLVLLPLTAFAEDVDFTWDPQNPRAGERVTFTGPDTDRSHRQPVIMWKWTWPDNTQTESLDTKVSDYTFTTAGKNTVTLMVKYADGQEKTFSHDITVSKYQPEVIIDDSSGSADFTAKVGDVGNRAVIYRLHCEKSDSVEVTYSIGSLTNTSSMFFKVNDADKLFQAFLDVDLNSLPVGDYPIKLSSPGNDQIEGFDLTLGTAHIVKYQPEVENTSGDGSTDFTAKIGDVGDRDLGFKLSGLPHIFNNLDLIYSIGPIRYTYYGWDSETSFTFDAYKDDLNSLPAGDYPIKLSSPGNDQIEGFDFTLGTAHIEKYQPVFSDINHSARYTGDSATLQLKLNCNEGYLETISYTLTINDKILGTGMINGDNAVLNIVVPGVNFMNLTPGIYDFKVKSVETDHNQSVQAKIGTLTIAGVTGVEIIPSASTVEKGGTLQFDTDVKIVSTTDCPVEDTVTWTVNGSHSSATMIDAAGRLTVGTDESADVLTIRATSMFDTNQSGTAEVRIAIPQPEVVDSDPVYSLTLQAGAGGTIIAGTSGSYTAGSTVSLQAKAGAGYEFAGWSSSNGGSFANSGSLSTTFTMPANATVVTAAFQKKNSVSPAPDYIDQTLTDPSGVRVSGLFTDGAVLEVKDKLPHLEGDCDVCDGIRERQKNGELIILFDLSLKSGKYTGELQVEIPVGETYNGQIVEILRCHEKVLESRAVTVQNGMAAGTFSSLSPYAVFKVQASAEVTGLPESYTLMTGETVSWTPVPVGGVWSYDSNLLEMTASGNTCTFKALKEGTAAITYTVDDATFTISLTVHSSAVSQPNVLGSVWLWALLAAGLLGCTALVIVKRNSGKKRNG